MAATSVPAVTETRTLRKGESLPLDIYLWVQYLGGGRVRFTRLSRAIPLAEAGKSDTMIPAAPSDPDAGEGD